MTMGLPGLILLAIASVIAGKAIWSAFRAQVGEGRDATFARLGGVALVIIALGSIGDYPLRTPALACVFVIAALWLAGADSGSTKSTPS